MGSTSKKKSVSTEELTVDLLKKMHRQNQMIISLLKEIKNGMGSEERKKDAPIPTKGRSKKQYVHVIDEILAEKTVPENPKKAKSTKPASPKKKAPKSAPKNAPHKTAVKKTPAKKKIEKKRIPVALSEESLIENSKGEENPFIAS